MNVLKWTHEVAWYKTTFCFRSMHLFCFLNWITTKIREKKLFLCSVFDTRLKQVKYERIKFTDHSINCTSNIIFDHYILLHKMIQTERKLLLNIKVIRKEMMPYVMQRFFKKIWKNKCIRGWWRHWPWICLVRKFEFIDLNSVFVFMFVLPVKHKY